MSPPCLAAVPSQRGFPRVSGDEPSYMPNYTPTPDVFPA